MCLLQHQQTKFKHCLHVWPDGTERHEREGHFVVVLGGVVDDVAVVEGHQEKYTNNPKNISWIKYFMCCFRIIFGLLVTAQVDNVWVLLHWTICKYSFPNDQILVNMMTKYHTLTMFMWMFEWMVWYGNSGFTIHSWPRCPSRPDGDIRPEAIFSTSFGSSRTASHRLVTCTCQIWISGWILPHFDVRTISVASKLKKLQIFLYY